MRAFSQSVPKYKSQVFSHYRSNKYQRYIRSILAIKHQNQTRSECSSGRKIKTFQSILGSKCTRQMGKTNSLKRVCNRVPLSPIPFMQNQFGQKSQNNQHQLLWEEINQMLQKEAIVEIKEQVKRVLLHFFS